MSSPRGSEYINGKRCSHRLMVASSLLSPPAEATIKAQPDHYEVLDFECTALSAGIKRVYPLLGNLRQWAKVRPRKIARKDESLEDRISRLPDDILVNIISRLTVAEAAATSVLSTRWKYLWTFITVLSFDVLNKLMIPEMTIVNEETLKDKITQYVNRVNKVLQSHRGSSINMFHVGFYFDASHESDFTNWIYTAVLKGVQNLILNFKSTFYLSSPCDRYTFPQKCYDLLKAPPYLSRLKSLRFLFLKNVNVTGEIMEFFIYNCPYLLKLVVTESLSLLRLKVVGPLLRLKYLYIYHCANLEELEISCPSLLLFKYFGRIIKCCIKNVPRLSNIAMGGLTHEYGTLVGRVFGPTGSHFPRLDNLELIIRLNEETNQFPRFELPALRYLTFLVFARNCSNLLDLACMMKSCPFLQKLTLELSRIEYSTEVISRHQCPKYSHRHLKTVEWFEFSGNPVELELAHYLLENATMLEKLLFKSRKGLFGEVAVEQAKKLNEVAPPRVKLVIC